MIWFLISQLFSMILTLLRLGRTSDADKDLEILHSETAAGHPAAQTGKTDPTRVQLQKMTSDKTGK